MSYYNRRSGDIPVTQVSHEEMKKSVKLNYNRLLLRYAELEIEIERVGRQLAEYRKRLDQYEQEDKQKTGGPDESTTGS